MGNSGISVNKSPAMRTADVDIITPLSSRALYWRLRYSAGSPFLGYMPFLFWLVETALPNVTVCLGVNAAVPYFGVCQAVDKLGLGSTCFGFEPQSGAASEDVVAHNRQFYADFSQIEAIDLREAATRIGKARVDLLVVNLPVDDALIAVLDVCWLPVLSDSAIVLFSAGVRPGAEGDYNAFIERIGAKAGAFLFGLPDHVAFVLYGDNHPDRLRHLTQLQLGQPPYLQVRQVFERLGEAYAQAWRLTALAAEAEREREAKAALQTALDERLGENEALRAQVAALQTVEAGKANLESQFESRLAAQDSWINDLETLVMEAEAATAAEKAEKLAALAALHALEAGQALEGGRGQDIGLGQASFVTTPATELDLEAVAALEQRLEESQKAQEEIAERAERERSALEARLSEAEARLHAHAGNSDLGEDSRDALLRRQAELIAERDSERAAFETRMAEYVETIEQLSNQLEAAEARNATVVKDKNADYLSQEVAALKVLNAMLCSENADLRSEMQKLRAGSELKLALQQHELGECEKGIVAQEDLAHTREKNMEASAGTDVPQQGGPDPRLIEMKDRLAARQAQIADILTGSQFSADYLALRPVLDEQVFAISRSGQFDVAWYRKAYPGTTGLLYDILRHFVRKGTFAGENPGPGFDTLRYYVDYPDVAEAGLCAFAHYLMRGKAEGRIAHRVQVESPMGTIAY